MAEIIQLTQIPAEQVENLSPAELSRIADAMLKEQGLTVWGRPKTHESYPQARFERGMPTGAYCSRKDRKR